MRVWLLARFAVTLALVVQGASVWADLIPNPQRPAWRDPPPPMPSPPELVAVALCLAVVAWAVARAIGRRGRGAGELA